VKDVAWDRAETDACQRGTVGCCIDHKNNDWPETECDVW
jgi:hypothetical protein